MMRFVSRHPLCVSPTLTHASCLSRGAGSPSRIKLGALGVRGKSPHKGAFSAAHSADRLASRPVAPRTSMRYMADTLGIVSQSTPRGAFSRRRRASRALLGGPDLGAHTFAPQLQAGHSIPKLQLTDCDAMGPAKGGYHEEVARIRRNTTPMQIPGAVKSRPCK